MNKRKRGQAIVLVALCSMLLFGMAAVAFDLSLTMSDRRTLQAAVDAAALAGAQSYPTSTNAAHYVAFQYLQKPLGFTLPLGACTSSAACPAGAYTIGAYTISVADPATGQMDLTVQHQEPAIFARLVGNSTVTTGSSVRAQAPGPTVISTPWGAVATTGQLGNNGGGATIREFFASVYAKTDFGGNNGSHAYMMHATQVDYTGAQCSPTITNELDHGGSTNALYWNWVGPPVSGLGVEKWNVASAPTPFDNYGPTPAAGAPTFNSVGFPASAKDGSGNWKPGIYDGVYPSGGKLNPGVYKLINVTSAITLGAITQVTTAASGQSDTNGAVVFVLDSSDTGALDFSQAVLNGIDDLNPQSYTGPRDPQGTHNFVFFSTSGANGYSGSTNYGPATNFDLSGIFYLPKYTITTNGSPSMLWTGPMTVADFHISGGGGSIQMVRWVCGLGAVLGNPSIQGGLNR